MGHVHNKQGRQGALFSASFRSVNQHTSVLNGFSEVKTGLRHEIPTFIFVQTDIYTLHLCSTSLSSGLDIYSAYILSSL